MKEEVKEKEYDLFFKLFLGGKIIYGFFELAAGIFLLVVSRATINLIFVSLTRGELLEDPNDFLSNYILKASESLTHNLQIFLSLYLLIYGIVKLALVVELLRNKIRFYPYAIGLFLLGILYLLYKLVVSFSTLTLLLTLFEAVTLLLIWHHYKRLSRSI
ncbi:MAG: DUF2127 domain-containing protein [Candidatus Pacebacteria bacterium]|nr:DUF2127 domain-containing protein [Candidatus Paceibacterota bacterium]